ncbi:hypothetical protein QQF64_023661 [Cirrhinus molitorella]|uniref:DUF4806 domain-containing protein n=1 Tax=Cirrhinus molitorella TaxID=172907 RepID=A0ABR3NJ16_9TELE
MPNDLKETLQVLLQKVESLAASQREILLLLRRNQGRQREDDVLDLKTAQCKEELEDLENQLKDPEFKKKVTHHLSLIGGANPGECVRRVMRAVATNSVWSHYSLHGKRKKLALIKTSTCKVMTRYTQQDRQVERAVTRRAPDDASTASTSGTAASLQRSRQRNIASFVRTPIGPLTKQKNNIKHSAATALQQNQRRGAERHTADNLACELKKICDEWGVTNKIAACVTDNASNVKAAIRKAELKHIPCFAHTLNLIVRESLKHIQETVAKVKNVVEYFHRSTVATERLKATQKQMGLEELSLKQDVTTRWNSTYYMLKRFCQQKEAVIATLALVNPSLTTLTLDEWDILKDVCELLKPFEEVTVEMSAERFVTASKVILMARGLQKVVQRLRGAGSKHSPVNAVMDSLAEDMQKRFRLLSEATLLDPRFKNRAFLDAKA